MHFLAFPSSVFLCNTPKLLRLGFVLFLYFMRFFFWHFNPAFFMRYSKIISFFLWYFWGGFSNPVFMQILKDFLRFYAHSFYAIPRLYIYYALLGIFFQHFYVIFYDFIHYLAFPFSVAVFFFFFLKTQFYTLLHLSIQRLSCDNQNFMQFLPFSYHFSNMILQFCFFVFFLFYAFLVVSMQRFMQKRIFMILCTSWHFH